VQDVAARIRLTAGLPIIMLTAKAAEIDRVLGLELGADDYITKTVSGPRELVLRIPEIALARAKPRRRARKTLRFWGFVHRWPAFHLVSWEGQKR